jgi:type I restriction enzyme S subunit
MSPPPSRGSSALSNWREVRLGDVCELKRGYDLPNANRRSGTVPIVSSSGISGYHSEAKVSGPGVVTGRYGTLGHVFYIKEDFWPLNTALYVRDFKGNDPRFVAALLQSMDLGRNDVAAAVPGVNRNQLHELRVLCPDHHTQESVAAILESLDDLIENNGRRIEVLEEMAQAIYQEWFVRFRYPGNEDATFVDSPIGRIPVGWQAITIGDVLELRYGRALKKDARQGGSVAVVGSSGIVGWHDEELVAGPSIIVGRKGNVGSITWVDGGAWPIDTTYFVATDLPLRYVVEQLRRTEFLNTHAAVPGLSRDQAYSRPFLQPPRELMEYFAGASNSMFSQAAQLRKQDEHLWSMRGLLLPRLVTGKINVARIDLNAVVKAVA